ncbi:MAG: DegV family protein [Roseburia sp.]|nr:DegV family protein [Roseburia sp.]
MFKLMTDSTADLPVEYLRQNHIGCINLSYLLDGITYGQGKELAPKDFFDMMREGKMPTTSQINPSEAKVFFEEAIQTDREILYLAFSSGLSGTYNNMRLAAEEIMEEHPDCRIEVVDTLCASMGEGLIVYKANQLRNQGKSLDEVKEWVESQKLRVIHVFTVDDLFHLYRGGRVSKTAAVIGTLVGIKPLLHVDDEGHLINIDKIRGRKKSLSALVEHMAEKVRDYDGENDMVMISHGDALEDAEYVRDLIKERFGIENFMINSLGPVIGAHTGPGLIALFFMGTER